MMATVLDFNSELEYLAELTGEPVPQFYYIQDARSYVGDSVLWWRQGGRGYTTNLDEAMKVMGDWAGRPLDILWPVHEIDARATRQFDAQNFRDIRRSK